MADGAADVNGRGETWVLSLTGNRPKTNDVFTVSMQDTLSQTTVQVGAGDASQIVPTFCLSFGGKVYILAGSTVYFSGENSPTVFNDPEQPFGNGFVNLLNQASTPEDMVAAVPFQGRLAFLSRNTTQIWSVPTDPNNWERLQVLENVGCIAKASIRALGDLDALFLSDTGIRSLRARETTLNAYSEDLGSPIDPILQPLIAANQTDAANALGIVEPTTGSYWLFFKDTIYVLSYYPTSKVIAWSTYEPKDNTGATFVPSKFVVYKGQLYARGSGATANKVYQYGGSNRITYDSTVLSFELPWLDLKTPGTMKTGTAINVACTGTWAVAIGMDPISGVLESPVYLKSNSSFDIGIVAMSSYGSHFKCSASSQGTLTSTPIKFSSLVFHYDGDEEV